MVGGGGTRSPNSMGHPLDPEFIPSSYKNKNPREPANKFIALLLA